MQYYEKVWIASDGLIFTDKELAEEYEELEIARQDLDNWINNLEKENLIEYECKGRIARVIERDKVILIDILERLK